MTRSVRLLLAAVLVAGVHCGVLAIQDTGMPSQVRPLRRDLKDLPTRLGPWTAQEGGEGTAILLDDDAEVHCLRQYRNAAGDAVSVYAAAWRQYRYSTPHYPEACCPGAGYQVLERRNIQLQVTDQKSIPARVLLLDRHGQKTCLLYWYRRGDEILLFDRWRRRAMWTFKSERVWPPVVKVMLQMPGSDAEKAESLFRSIAVPIFDWTKDI